MVVINLKTNFKDLEGKDTPDNMGKLLANIIANGKETDVLKVIKHMDWAKALYNEGSISVDEADRIAIRDMVINNDMLTTLAKAQLIEVIGK
jgi:hypothetical protein